MKIYISKATYIETDDLSNEELLQSYTYYYQLGRRDVALQFTKESEKRQQAELKEKKEVTKLDDNNKDKHKEFVNAKNH